MLRRLLLNAAVLAIGLWGLSAQAAITGGDFRAESSMQYPISAGPLYENLGATVGAGYELDSSHFVANPGGWTGGVVFMDLDPLTNILTLASQDFWGFELFTAGISNMSFSEGEVITGISLLSDNLTSPLPLVVPTWSFTANSVLVSYNNAPDTNGFYFSHGTATFQLTTAVTAVPEPEIYAMVGLGLGMMGWVGRRRKQQAA